MKFDQRSNRGLRPFRLNVIDFVLQMSILVTAKLLTSVQTMKTEDWMSGPCLISKY